MKSESKIAAGKIFVGKVNRNGDTNKVHGPRNCAVYVTWELSNGENGPEFSAQAEAWNCRRTDIFIGGQCLETFAKMMHGDARRILEIWREWHLNGTNAGTVEQENALEAAKLAAVEQALSLPNPERYFYDIAKRELNPHTLGTVAGLKESDYYSWACHVLKQAGLYEVPLPAGQKCTGDFPPEVLNGSRGYRYGERWLYRQLPASIVQELKTMQAKHAAAI